MRTISLGNAQKMITLKVCINVRRRKKDCFSSLYDYLDSWSLELEHQVCAGLSGRSWKCVSQGGWMLIRDSALHLAAGCWVQQGMDAKWFLNKRFNKNDISSFCLLATMFSDLKPLGRSVKKCKAIPASIINQDSVTQCASKHRPNVQIVMFMHSDLINETFSGSILPSIEIYSSLNSCRALRDSDRLFCQWEVLEASGKHKHTLSFLPFLLLVTSRVTSPRSWSANVDAKQIRVEPLLTPGSLEETEMILKSSSHCCKHTLWWTGKLGEQENKLDTVYIWMRGRDRRCRAGFLLITHPI